MRVFNTIQHSARTYPVLSIASRRVYKSVFESDDLRVAERMDPATEFNIAKGTSLIVSLCTPTAVWHCLAPALILSWHCVAVCAGILSLPVLILSLPVLILSLPVLILSLPVLILSLPVLILSLLVLILSLLVLILSLPVLILSLRSAQQD